MTLTTFDMQSNGRRTPVESNSIVFCNRVRCPYTPISTMLPSGGEHGIMASSALSLIIRPDGASDTKVNTGLPCLRCSRTKGLEQPPGAPFVTLHHGHFQTFTQVCGVLLLRQYCDFVQRHALFTALYELTIIHYIRSHKRKRGVE